MYHVFDGRWLAVRAAAGRRGRGQALAFQAGQVVGLLHDYLVHWRLVRLDPWVTNLRSLPLSICKSASMGFH